MINTNNFGELLYAAHRDYIKREIAKAKPLDPEIKTAGDIVKDQYKK